MKSILLLVVVGGLALTACSISDPAKINEPPTIDAELLGAETKTLQGTYYLLPFPLSALTADGWDISVLSDKIEGTHTPEITTQCNLQILDPVGNVAFVEQEFGTGKNRYRAWVYAFVGKFTVRREADSSACTGNIFIRFPQVLETIRHQGFAADLPEIHFKISHYPTRHSRGIGGLGTDLGYFLILLLLYIAIITLAVKGTKVGGLGGCVTLVFLLTAFLFLRDIFWILHASEVRLMLFAWLLLHAPDVYGLSLRAVRRRKELKNVAIVVCGISALLAVLLLPVFIPVLASSIREVTGNLWVYIRSNGLLTASIFASLVILSRVRVKPKLLQLKAGKYRYVSLRMHPVLLAICKTAYRMLYVLTYGLILLILIVGVHQMEGYSPRYLPFHLNDAFYMHPIPLQFSDVYPQFIDLMTSGYGILIMLIVFEIILWLIRQMVLNSRWFRVTCPSCQKIVTLRVHADGLCQCPGCRQFFLSQNKMSTERLVSNGSVLAAINWVWSLLTRPIWRYVINKTREMTSKHGASLGKTSRLLAGWLVSVVEKPISSRKYNSKESSLGQDTNLTAHTLALLAAENPSNDYATTLSGIARLLKPLTGILITWMGPRRDFLLPVTNRLVMCIRKAPNRPDIRSFLEVVDRELHGLTPDDLKGFDTDDDSGNPLFWMTSAGQIDLHPESYWVTPNETRRSGINAAQIEATNHLDTLAGRRAERARLFWRSFAGTAVYLSISLACGILLAIQVNRHPSIAPFTLIWGLLHMPVLFALGWQARSHRDILLRLTFFANLLALVALLYLSAAALWNLQATDPLQREQLFGEYTNRLLWIALAACLAAFLLALYAYDLLEHDSPKPPPWGLKLLRLALIGIGFLIALQALIGVIISPFLTIKITMLWAHLVSGVSPPPLAAFVALLLVIGIYWALGRLVFTRSGLYLRLCPACGEREYFELNSGRIYRCPSCLQAFVAPRRTPAQEILDYGLILHGVVRFMKYVDEYYIAVLNPGHKYELEPKRFQVERSVRTLNEIISVGFLALSAMIMALRLSTNFVGWTGHKGGFPLWFSLGIILVILSAIGVLHHRRWVIPVVVVYAATFLMYIQIWLPKIDANQQAVSARATLQAIETVKTGVTKGWITLVSDPFNSNHNKWYETSVDDQWARISFEIKDGKYVWDATAHQSFIYRVILPYSVKDFYYTFDVTQPETQTDDDYGMVFRLYDHNNYYYFAINSEGNFSVWLNKDSTWTRKIGYTRSAAIRPGETNKLGVLAEGDHFTFYINDLYVAEMSDQSLKQGHVGMAVEIDQPDLNVIYEFDDVLLKLPDQ